MSDDDNATTDEPVSDAAEETTVEPAAEPEAEAEEKPAEVTTEEEPKEEIAKDEPSTTPAAEPAGTDQQGRTLYNVKCSNCGKDTQVPFQPSGDRPVYCRDCFMQRKNAQG
ncbi:MAG: CxxC-x17-CxxC domain-containing protein [Patescibacteria group bacterium]